MIRNPFRKKSRPHFLKPIEVEVLGWRNVTSEPHRYQAVAFNLDLGNRSVEIGHIHQGKVLDVLFTKRIRDALLEESSVSEHPHAPNSGWVQYVLQEEKDVREALWLLRLSYLQKRWKYRQGADPLEIQKLGLGSDLHEAAFGKHIHQVNKQYPLLEIH